MTLTKLVLLLVCLMPVTLGPKEAPNEAKVTPLFTKDLPDFPGKEGVMITVEYPPGSSDPIHRHNADAFVYVLEGSIVMQLRGGKEVTLKPGQTFYEGPDDVHVVGKNASQTKPAKFVVFLVKDKGTPIVARGGLHTEAFRIGMERIGHGGQMIELQYPTSCIVFHLRWSIKTRVGLWNS